MRICRVLKLWGLTISAKCKLVSVECTLNLTEAQSMALLNENKLGLWKPFVRISVTIDPHGQHKVVRSSGGHEVELMTSIIMLVNGLAQDVSSHHPVHV